MQEGYFNNGLERILCGQMGDIDWTGEKGTAEHIQMLLMQFPEE